MIVTMPTVHLIHGYLGAATPTAGPPPTWNTSI
jgi:hypothetical protein